MTPRALLPLVRRRVAPAIAVLLIALLVAGGVTVVARAQGNAGAQAPGLNGIADVYRAAAAGWQARLVPIAQRTFMLLATLEVCVSGLVWAVKRESLDDLAAKFLLKFTLIAFLLTLITSANVWLPAIFNGFGSAGEQVTGGGTLTPNGVVDLGAQLAWQMAGSVMQTAFAGNLVMSIVCAACVIVLFGSYLAVAIQLLLVMVDSYITILGGGVLFLGFAASRWTAAYAEHLIAHVFYLGARAFFLYLVVAVGIDITNAVQPYLGTADTLLGYGGTLLRVVGAVVAFAVIAWTIPKDVAWRLMGRTSFGLAQAMRALS